MNDDYVSFNRERWNDLVRAGVVWGRPRLNLDPASARAAVDPLNLIGDLHGKDALCLASGGGQQSAAFAVAGANTTVLDLSDEMLANDRLVAQHYGLNIRIEQGDMRDLSRFADDSFDMIYHAYSINFIPNVEAVFDEVQRVLRPGGIYHLQYSNPFFFNVEESSWTGQGYLLSDRYIDGAEANDTDWDVYAEDGSHRKVKGPREWRHTMSKTINGLASRGFALLWFREELGDNPQADPQPGSWDHFVSCAPPWFYLWYRYLPDVLGAKSQQP